MSSRFHKRMPLAEAPGHLTSPPYIFICSSSFEDRCLSFPGIMDPSIVSQALVCQNEDLRDVVGSNTERLLAMFGEKAVRVLLRTDNPLYGADNIHRALEQFTPGVARNYLIDATTFTHEGLLILLNLLHRNGKPMDAALIAYNPAKGYADWLTKGIGEIRSVLGYPGTPRPSRKCHLIVLTGYEVERAGMLIDAYEPAVVSLGLGGAEESVSKGLYKRNVLFHRRLKEKLKNVNEFTFSCVDAYATKSAIERQIQEVKDFNVVLAPMNTKISSVGAAMAAFSDERIQLCYAQAQQYNHEWYSVPSDECILFDARGVFGE